VELIFGDYKCQVGLQLQDEESKAVIYNIITCLSKTCSLMEVSDSLNGSTVR